MIGSKNAKNRTKGGSPIVTVRPRADMSGGKSRGYKLAAVKAKNGETYMVPVDTDGKVPTEALYGRFLDETSGDRQGKRRRPSVDRQQTAATIHKIPKGGFTPEEIIETGWWQYPNESDILGIDDTPSGAMGDFGSEAAKFEKAAAGKIAIIAPTDEERRRVAGVLAANFTASEIKAAAWDYGLTISIGNPGRGCNGYYMGRQTGNNTARIVLRPYASDETIVHEFGHHLRRVDSKRHGVTKCPYPVLADDREAPDFGQANYAELSNLEEAANVAEVTGRTIGLEKSATGYYEMIPGGSSLQENFQYDRKLLTGGLGAESKPKRGKRLVNTVEEDFDDTTISGLKYKGRRPAIKVADDLRANGTIAPRKPKKGGKR